ncbi:hypothetical protein MN116_008185 [Schistosoma mekongi]|uniref:Kinase n=1 Tax=Schistosoma mekongi TaxID=38744 RepID=A0AAE1Z5P0_SCHME|nr:hypothetical protein MN116_008185 [Schistosoma mekongi]
MITNNECCSMNDQTNKLNYLFENSSLLPLDLIDYPNQIGGHGLLFGNKSKILYSNVQSTIYKPIQHYPKGPHELEFYQHLFDPNCCNTVLIRLRQFVPDFYGLYRDSEGKHFYLGLKDLLASFKNPSLCDLKMGCRTYAPDSSPSKVMVECAKYKWREEIGFLVTGLKEESSKIWGQQDAKEKNEEINTSPTKPNSIDLTDRILNQHETILLTN